MSSHEDLSYAIIGGGIAGLTLGLALHHRGIDVRIYEAAHHFGEIGAGVSFTPNAIHAMKICHPAVHAAFESVATLNKWPSKKDHWFDFYDVDGERTQTLIHSFDIHAQYGQNGVHRAQFLSELVKAFPPERAEFGKRLEKYEKNANGEFTLHFRDGTTATAHAVIGCDGIKSHVRASMFGRDHPCAAPSYTHKYAYRALVPIQDAIDTMGEENAVNANFYLGQDGHILTFPVQHYKVMNLVAFFTDPNDWTDREHLTAPTTRDAMLADFKHFSPQIQKLLSLAKPNLDKWAIFDLGDNPPPTFVQGRVCLLGDAAHATSPHHGAGAGMCIEDAAVLASLLADSRVDSYDAVEAAFAIYDAVRRPRGEMLVASSRFLGKMYDGQGPYNGAEYDKIKTEIAERNGRIHNVDVPGLCEEARAKLGERLASTA